MYLGFFSSRLAAGCSFYRKKYTKLRQTTSGLEASLPWHTVIIYADRQIVFCAAADKCEHSSFVVILKSKWTWHLWN